MSRTSKTLTRLGVAGVAAVTMGAGLPALLASSASAADAAQLTLSPNPGKAAAGTCQVFTVDATDASGAPATYGTATPTLTVQVSENPNNANQSVSFCNVTGNFANTGDNTGTGATSTTAQGTANFSRTAASGSTVTATTPTRATFGIRSNAPGGANIRAFIDANNNNAFDAGEIQVLGSTTFSAGGSNTASNVQGGNAAQDAASVLTPGATNSPVTAGSVATATVNVKNAAGDTVSGVVVNFRVTAGPNAAQTNATGTVTTAAQSGQAVSDNAGNAVIQYTTNADRTGTDTVQFFVNQTTGTSGGPEAGEPQATTSITISPRPNQVAAEARNITITPTSQTTVAGNSQVFTATVTDVAGRPVQGASVSFLEEGPGRFTGGGSTATVLTDATGTAKVTTTSVVGESGTEIITASLSSTGTQCSQAAGAGTNSTATSTAGNCSVTATQTFVASTPSPSASASASPSVSASPSTSPSATPSVSVSPSATTPSRLGVSVSPDVIIPGRASTVRVTGTPGSVVELQAYSRPSTTYTVVRRGTIDSSGVITFLVTPGTNTRLFAAVTNVANTESPSVVINVRTALSLTVVRNGRRNYTFQGRILPRRAGQLITLYRITNSGSRVLTSQIKTDATGTYRINRVFTGSGTFGFLTRTGQTLTNASGESNTSESNIASGTGTSRPTAIF